MNPGATEPRLFLALDVDDVAHAERLAESLRDTGIGMKLGPRLMMREGRRLVALMAKHSPVFVDCKHFDIPSTMEAAVRTAFDTGAQYTTIHALAGPEALAKMATLEAELQRERPFRILCVTVLTSFSDNTLPFGLRDRNLERLVEGLADEAYASGLKSFVCSSREAARMRGLFPDAFLVTPGIRPAGSAIGDQIRVETPALAAKAGANALVVGRPILSASEPRVAAIAILNEFSQASIQR